jgi:hypothetical protein
MTLGSEALSMDFEDFRTAITSWFKERYSGRTTELFVQHIAKSEAKLVIRVINNGRLGDDQPASFNVLYSSVSALQHAQINIETKMLTRDERRSQLMASDVDDPMSGALIDDFYTDFAVIEGDRVYLERFLHSSDLETRREALIGLTFGVNKDTGPRFVGYAKEALMLHLLGVIEETDSQYTGVSVLAVLEARGDEEAGAILESLGKNNKWRSAFM